MKKLPLLLVLLIALPPAFADWAYNSENIIVNMDISSYMDIVKSAPNGHIESASVNLTFFPKTTGTQRVLQYETIPEAEASEKTLRFTWKKPEEIIYFRYSGKIITTNSITRVNEKIQFPIVNLPDDVRIYTKPSKTIDSDDEEIIRLASEIVKGEDDLFVAVFRVADWTKYNIKYDLSTLTADVSQKASWVLQNREGVCDELTSLFIAMLRSVGVPARFVSGISYTNSDLFTEKWGPHGWAEAYFPGYGWVPFDVTYGEYGWIDPAHIKFKDSIDPDESSTYYQWLGRNADLKTKELDIKTTLVESSGYSRPSIELVASAFRKTTGFGSYNLIEADIRNKENFYYATDVYLSKSRDIQIVGGESKSILLLPNERKKVFWIVKVDGSLDRKYAYTFPFTVSTTNNRSASTSFSSSVRETRVSLEEVQKAASLIEEERQKEYSAKVLFDCSISKDEFYADESAEVDCSAMNIGNIFLENLEGCFEEQCTTLDLGISQKKDFSFNVGSMSEGIKQIPAVLRNDFVSKSSYLDFRVKDKPSITIEEVRYPLNASYKNNITISFTIKPVSQSNPKGVEIILKQNDLEKIWNMAELTEDRKFVVNIEGNQLRYGQNDYRIDAVYYDDASRRYESSKEFIIQLTDATLLQRMVLSLNSLEGVSSEAIAMILLTGIITFLIIVLIVFRKNKKLE